MSCAAWRIIRRPEYRDDLDAIEACDCLRRTLPQTQILGVDSELTSGRDRDCEARTWITLAAESK